MANATDAIGMKIVINGDCPSKKNSRALVVRGGRPFSFPGKHYAQWLRDVNKQLLGKRLEYPVVNSISMTFYPATKRKSDLTNKAESVMDALVFNEILSDDNWFVVPTISLNFGGVDPKNPRVEIQIK